MNIQRFTAATSREALAKARMAFGEGTLILSNRPTEHGVEVVATAEDSLAQLDEDMAVASAKTAPQPRREAPPSYKDVAGKVEDDATQLAMSTLSFQDYVRERMLRKRSESGQSPAQERSNTFTSEAPPFKPTPAAPKAAQIVRKTAAAPAAAATSALPQGIVEELHAMKEM
ncbi:MAG: flagellar biosynthesis protein FlhF, partial [Rhodoferax sp.]|nr:flagellar biosynthesis protein FlhF [Rhodoferax sp.]